MITSPELDDSTMRPIEPGDIVVPNDGNWLRSGAQAYDFAIVGSLEPFILVSELGDMVWQATVKIENFRMVGRATPAMLAAVRERMGREVARLAPLAKAQEARVMQAASDLASGKASSVAAALATAFATTPEPARQLLDLARHFLELAEAAEAEREATSNQYMKRYHLGQREAFQNAAYKIVMSKPV